jgi:hypothetical protein
MAEQYRASVNGGTTIATGALHTVLAAVVPLVDRGYTAYIWANTRIICDIKNRNCGHMHCYPLNHATERTLTEYNRSRPHAVEHCDYLDPLSQPDLPPAQHP